MSLETAFSAGTPIAASKMPITPATLRSDAATRAAPDDMVACNTVGVPAHRFHGPPDPPCPTRASDGLDQARVIVLDVANSRAHWPACHFLGRIGCEQGFGLGSVGGASQTGHISGHSWCSPKFARCVCSDLRDA